MSYSFDGTNDRMTGEFANNFDLPITVACWFKIAAHPAVVDNIVALGASESSVANSLNLRTSGAAADQYQATQIGIDGGFDPASVVKSGINATWTPFIGRFTSDNNRDVYVADLTTNSTGSSAGVNTLRHLRMGESFTGGSDFTGQLAEIAIWDTALSDSEIAQYQSGVPASSIAAANLIGYWPLDTESGTQENEGVNSGGDLAVVGATFSAEHPPISTGGGSFLVDVVAAEIEPTGRSVPLDRGMPVTRADLQSAGQAAAYVLAASVTAAIPVIDPQLISLGFIVEGEVAVETAIPTLSPGNVTLALKSPVTKADITLAPQAVNLIPAGTVRVDSGTPTISGSNITPEITKFFDVGTLGLVGRDVGLRRGTPVISAAPTIAGSEITLTVPATITMAVETASLAPAGQDVGFQITWVIPVTSASFDIDGINVELQFAIDDGITVEPAQPSIDGQDIIGGVGIKVAEALPTIAPQSISFILDQRIEVGFDEEGIETLTQVSFAGQEITLESTFTLGVVVEAGAFSIAGQDITGFTGSGVPTTIKGYFKSWSAHGSFSAPIAVGDATSKQISKVG